MKLSEAAEILGTPPRKLQYLRERHLVKPSIAGQGRGHHARYTREDLMGAAVYLALEEMTDVERFDKIMVALIRGDCEVALEMLNGAVEFRVYVDKLRASVT